MSGIVEKMQKTYRDSRWTVKLAVANKEWGGGTLAHLGVKMNYFPNQVSKIVFLPEVAGGTRTPASRWWFSCPHP